MSQPDGITNLPDFTGKLVLVFQEEGVVPGVGTLVTDARLEMQAGRLFVVGVLADVAGKWTGAPVAIAWDSVVKYILLDSIEDFQRRTAQSPARRGWFGKG
jgi:hypothetical protein